MSQNWLIDAFGSMPQANTRMIDLSPGNNQSIWSRVTNLRLEKDSTYEFWKLRGGSAVIETFDSDIVKTFGFQTTVQAQLKSFIVAVLSNGSIKILDLKTSVVQEILSTGGSIDTVFSNIGQFLYIIDPGNGTANTYDIKESLVYPWNFSKGSRIRSVSSQPGTGLASKPNPWGYVDSGIAFATFIDDLFPDIVSDNVGISRSYLIVDLLKDGSLSIPGQVYTHRFTKGEIKDINAGNPIQHFLLTIAHPIDVVSSSDPTQVSSRKIYATRFRRYLDIDNLSPSTPDFPNGQFFLHSEIPAILDGFLGAGTFRDTVPDSQLINPLSDIIPLSAGVFTGFGPGQISPKVLSSYKGALFLGNYDIQKPIPVPYEGLPFSNNSENGPQNGNIAISDNLSGSAQAYTLSFLFEYADGTTSGIVDTTHSYRTGTENEQTQYQIHALNSLVGTVYVLAKSGSDYKLLRTHSINSRECNGFTVAINLTTAEIDAFNDYEPPAQSNVLQVQPLYDHLLYAIPAQNILIESQQRIAQPAFINGIIPLQFDSDRSNLRYLVAVLTDQDTQLGYLTEQLVNNRLVFSSQFEVIDPSVSSITGSGYNRVKDFVVFQSNHGVSVINGRTTQLLIDKREYPVVENGLASVVYNKEFSEMWMLFRESQIVLVADDINGSIRQYKYPDLGLVRDGVGVGNSIYIAIGDSLMQTDMQNIGTDPSTIASSAVITIDGNNFTFGTQNDPLVFSDGTNSVSITTINDGGLDPVNTIAAEIALRINEGNLGIEAIATGANVTLVNNTSANVTITMSAEQEISTPGGNNPFTIVQSLDITGEALSDYLVDDLMQLKVLEATIYGDGISAQMDIDLQKSRDESSNLNWTKDFTADYQSSTGECKMSGLSFQVHKRGRKPRILLKLSQGFKGFVESIRLKVESTQNIGKAR